MSTADPKLSISYTPIGVIRSIHASPEQTPIQPVYSCGCRGTAEIFEQYCEGLNDLDGFSHIMLIYHFHRAGPARMMVRPFLQDKLRGLFSTRAPVRPNPIGLSIVRLLSREGTVLHLDCLDVLDGTPLLDIKPYVSRFDCIHETRCGWQDEVDENEAQRVGMRGYLSGSVPKKGRS
ncbi:MAG: tRNA (N6-threonylcarbamoyladenosine(37)-N6)-methyltransferase TrmO [Pseudomonadota bacterium]|jgi:tRNA-Thr(GGU) m(6)t(6)A37 methyltransferase TsaA|uniref:Putative tRNA (Adenine(37)-N6)-methyltransferase n=1 Tax=anaerobic digester metagenome TaxID=1263854 RepID=A0A485LU96_9ZZZZ|nr:tRNA (N6-threonylcarbamoyladenosine(37)-N6)-methyltransferase TrmO [Pseudomonadota bacterium]